MRDDDERRAELAIQLEHQLEHLPRVRAIEIAGRLVGEHDRRLRHQRARDGRALPLAAGELSRAMLEPRASPTRSSSCRARARASSTGMRRISNGIATFSSAVNSGSR